MRGGNARQHTTLLHTLYLFVILYTGNKQVNQRAHVNRMTRDKISMTRQVRVENPEP